MQRLFRLTAAFVAAFMVIFAAGPILASAQAGVTSDTTYESPNFGYEVEWTEDWAVMEDFTFTGDNSDQIRLLNESLGIWVDILGFDTNRSAESMYDAYFTLLDDSSTYENVEVTDVDTTMDDTLAAIYNYDFGTNAVPLEELAEFRMIDGAFIITSVKAAPDRSLLAAGLVATMILIEGDASFPAIFGEDSGNTTTNTTDDETPPPASSGSTTGDGLDGNVYSSPNYGVALSFDDDVWEVNDEHEAVDDEDRDALTLDLIDTPGRLWLEAYSTVTRASDCIVSASDEVLPDDADAELLVDENGDDFEGSSRGVAWAAYTWENEDGDALAAYVECRALPGGAGVFVATLLTTFDDFEDAFNATADILVTVNIEGGDPLEVEGNTPEEDETPTPESDRGNSSTGTGTEYESPTWGFTLLVDEDVWEIARDRTRSEVDTLQLEAAGDLYLDISSFELGRRDDAQSCAEDFMDEFDFEIDIADEVENDGVYSILGSYVDDDDEEWSIVITCQESPDGDFVVRAVGEAPIDAEEDLLDAMAPVLNSVEFP